ncbi:MAG TPA: arginine--tRNA ligase [bacterium]|nr:arginine--tRNA ligase [bacterium]
MLASSVEKILQKALDILLPGVDVPVRLVPPAKPEFGDFAFAAMPLARPLGRKPLDIAKDIADALRVSGEFAKVEVAAPGYVNMTMADSFWTDRLREVLAARASFGASDAGNGTKVLLEYVSANPTGPLHVGHARNAAVADTVANLMTAAGYLVRREFYVNDMGVQMKNLGRSVWYRYAEALGKLSFPATVAEPKNDAPAEEKRRYERFGGLYFGDYVKEVAAAWREREGEKWLAGATTEDGVLEPSNAAVEAARDFAYPILLKEQKETLERYGVRFDRWFSERTLHDEKLVDAALADLRERRALYESHRDESISAAERAKRKMPDEDPTKIATWFRASAFGDVRDRVLIKFGGEKTYLTADIAYHREKLQRGFQMLINCWGADHHGQVPSMRAALAALGFDPKAFHVILIQMVRLMKGGTEVKMSKRSGTFVTLQEIIEEVGPDAARFLMLTRSPESQLDFDLDLAKKQSNDNPVFYVQYGHARVCSVFAKAKAEAPGVDPSKADLSALSTQMEREMMKRLARFPDEIADAASRREPHRITTYLQDLVRAFHAYYSAKDDKGAPTHRIVSPDPRLTAARLALADAVRIVLANGLKLCGVTAPEKMEAPAEADANA